MNRLTTEQVATVMERGRSAQGRFFLLKYIIDPKTEKKSGTKQLFAAVASKKIFKTAVLRNKAKRRTREAVRSIVLPKIDLWCVVLVRADVFKVDIKTFSEELAQVFKKQGILV